MPAYLAWDLYGAPLLEIANALGYCRASSVSMACRRVDDALQSGPLRAAIRRIRRGLGPPGH